MSSIVSTALRLACGLLINKLPESTINELRHGEEREQKFREIILEELDSVLKKLESQQVKGKDIEQKQAKKELFETISPFKEGLVSLYQVLDKTRNRREESCESSAQGQEQRLVLELDIAEEQSFYNAKASFKKAREDATRVLGNDELSLSERVLITKIQVAARLLESMANQTDAADAVGACKVYLQDLHSLPPICEAFDVHFNGGIKSWFNKKQRVELITNVALINRVVYKYADSYAGENVQPTEWPTIDTGSDVILGRVRSRSIHPVTNFRVRKLIKECKVPLDITIDPRCFGHEGAEEEILTQPTGIAVNSHGQILVADAAKSSIKLYNTWGKFEGSISPPIENGECSFIPRSLATDREDNVYVISQDLFCSSSRGELFVLSKQGNLKHKFALREDSSYLSLTVDDSCLVFVLAKSSELYHVEVYKSDGEFLRCFQKGLHTPLSIVAGYNEILVADSNGPGAKGSVKIFGTNGRFLRQFKVMNSFIKASGIAFNPLSNIIALVTRDSESYEGQVEVHDISGKLLFLVPLAIPSYLGERSEFEFYGATITSEGRVSVMSKRISLTSQLKNHEENIAMDTDREGNELENLSSTEQLNASENCQEQNSIDDVMPKQTEDDDATKTNNSEHISDITVVKSAPSKPDQNLIHEETADENLPNQESRNQFLAIEDSSDQNLANQEITQDQEHVEQNSLDQESAAKEEEGHIKGVGTGHITDEKTIFEERLHSVEEETDSGPPAIQQNGISRAHKHITRSNHEGHDSSAIYMILVV